MEVDPSIRPLALFQAIKERLKIDLKMELKQFDKDIDCWVEVDKSELEVVNGAQFEVIQKVHNA